MFGQLKVYGGNVYQGGKIRKAVVAAKNKKEVLSVLSRDKRVTYSSSEVRDYWRETGSSKERALKKPRTLILL